MFSGRLDWEARPNALTCLLADKHRRGEPILDLTESNPTHAGIVYPSAEIAASFADERAVLYEPMATGLLSAREAVVEYYAGRGIEVDAARVLLTASTSEAYAFLFKLLADPGDEVLVPRPSYPLFEYLARLESVRVRHYPLFYDHGWHVDIAALEACVNERTRAVVVVNPNNPTGSYLKREELHRLVAICASRGLAIISDEVFSDYALRDDADRATTVAGLRDVPAFALSGLSKIAGLPQMKLGWMLVNDDPALERLELIADTYLSVGTPVQLALPRLLALHGGVQSQINARTRENLAWLTGALASAPSIRLLDVEGGWYVILQVPRIRSEEEWVLRLLRDCGVLVQPGFFYDFEQEAYLVVSLLTAPDVFREGVQRVLTY